MSRAGSRVFSVPGKTFLIGEYLALKGGPSILLSTEPRFRLSVTDEGEGEGESEGEIEGGAEAADLAQRLPFAPLSPAGRYFDLHREHDREDDRERDQERFNGGAIRFEDPHGGKGGLGASSAQFAMLYAYANGIASVKDPASFGWSDLLRDYRAVAWNGEGTPPSGADVVSQMCGGITWFDGSEFKARWLDWAFRDLEFTLFRTGFKLATHEHLQSPRAGQAAPHEALRAVVREATNSFETGNNSRLVEAITECGDVLEASGLVAEGTREILRDLKSTGFIRAAKGCGAMGADVVLALHDRDQAASLRAWCAEHRGREICGSLATLAEGLRMDVSG